MMPGKQAGWAWIAASASAAAVLLGGCDTPPPAPAGRPVVFVSIPPQAFLAERLAGPWVDLDVLIGPGQNPHNYEPTPRQIAELGAAKVLFLVGVPFEKGLVEKIRGAAPAVELIDTSAGVPLRTMEHDCAEHEEAGHGAHGTASAPGDEHADDHSHATGAADPHIWLDPRNAIRMAGVMAEQLAHLLPAHAAEIRQRQAALTADLSALDADLRAALAPLQGQEVFVYHPAYGYFCDAYGLRQVPVEVEGKTPTVRQLVRLVQRARTAHVRVIFVQPQFNQQAADAVASEIGGAVVKLDPLARDYIENLRQIAAAVRGALTPA